MFANQAQAVIAGGRLAHVAVPLDGTVEREVINLETKAKSQKSGRATMVEMRKVKVAKPGGYLVYFPQGHVLRLTKQQLEHYNLNKPARIINMSGLTDPNTAVGQLMMAQTNAARENAMTAIEDFTKQLAEKKSGKIVVHDYTPPAEGKIKKEAA